MLDPLLSISTGNAVTYRENFLYYQSSADLPYRYLPLGLCLQEH